MSGATYAGDFAVPLAHAVALLEQLETHDVGRVPGDITARAQVTPASLSEAHAGCAAAGKARLIVNLTVQNGKNMDVMRVVAS